MYLFQQEGSYESSIEDEMSSMMGTPETRQRTVSIMNDDYARIVSVVDGKVRQQIFETGHVHKKKGHVFVF